jgi:hypothetical protein
MRQQQNNEKIAALIAEVLGTYVVGPAIFAGLLWLVFPILAFWEWLCIGIVINYLTKQVR